MLEVKNLSKCFKTRNLNGAFEVVKVLDSISFSIDKGKIVSFLGPSGCGKSTLLEILAGIQIPGEGSVLINGIPLIESVPLDKKGLKDYKRKYKYLSPLSNGFFSDKRKPNIAMVFQDYSVFPWMTVFKNMIYILSLRGVTDNDRKAVAVSCLKKVGLNESCNKYPSQLSGGMKQRLALARALSVEPEIIFMDEPFASVDRFTREELQDLLVDISESLKLTVIFVTHDIEEAIYLSDEIYLFKGNRGKLTEKITVDIQRPRRRRTDESITLEDRVSGILKENSKRQ